jgi:uncharacterized protein (UPF0248 family)
MSTKHSRAGKETMKRIYVVHEDGDDLGLRPVEFATEDRAIIARDAWNKEIPGHRVVVIEESSEPNAESEVSE